MYANATADARNFKEPLKECARLTSNLVARRGILPELHERTINEAQSHP